MMNEFYPDLDEIRASCVDGARMARCLWQMTKLVGAVMCSAFECGSRNRWP